MPKTVLWTITCIGYPALEPAPLAPKLTQSLSEVYCDSLIIGRHHTFQRVDFHASTKGVQSASTEEVFNLSLSSDDVPNMAQLAEIMSQTFCVHSERVIFAFQSEGIEDSSGSVSVQSWIKFLDLIRGVMSFTIKIQSAIYDVDMLRNLFAALAIESSDTGEGSACFKLPNLKILDIGFYYPQENDSDFDQFADLLIQCLESRRKNGMRLSQLRIAKPNPFSEEQTRKIEILVGSFSWEIQDDPNCSDEEEDEESDGDEDEDEDEDEENEEDENEEENGDGD